MPLSPLSPIAPALHKPFEVDLTIHAETFDVASPIDDIYGFVATPIGGGGNYHAADPVPTAEYNSSA